MNPNTNPDSTGTNDVEIEGDLSEADLHDLDGGDGGQPTYPPYL